MLLKKDATCHGEITAIRRASRRLSTYDISGCEIYTTGEPCPMCLAAIKWANISRVYYRCNISDAERIGFRDKKFYKEEKENFAIELDLDEYLKHYREYMESEGQGY